MGLWTVLASWVIGVPVAVIGLIALCQLCSALRPALPPFETPPRGSPAASDRVACALESPRPCEGRGRRTVRAGSNLAGHATGRKRGTVFGKRGAVFG